MASILSKLDELGNGGDKNTVLAALKNGTLKVGDYLNYQAPAVNETISDSLSGAMADETTPYGGQTFTITQEQSTQMGWRILGYGNANVELTLDPNEATNVLLISANPAQTYLTLGKEQAYLNGSTILNNLSSKFATSGEMPSSSRTNQTTARSVKIEDINTALGITIEGTTILRNGTELEDGDYEVEQGTYTYTATDWVMEEDSVSYGTGAGETINMYRYWYDVEAGDSSDVIGHLLIDGTTEDDDYEKVYWLASTGIGYKTFEIGAIEDNAAGIFYPVFTEGYWGVHCYGVRPIVSLASGIQYGTGEGELTKVEAPSGWSTEDEAGRIASGQYQNH